MPKQKLTWVRTGVSLVLVAGLALGASPARAQDPDEPAIVPLDTGRPDEVETDPIRCWWKSDKLAVYVAEQFTLTLTCSVIETSTIRVVPNRVDLEPGTVQLSPFELVGGQIFEDVVAPPWRYFQYEYRVRLVSDGFFGQDVQIPPLQVVYNIESVENEGTQGRDQGYVLPALSVRVLSLVLPGADDIRDASTETFGAIEGRRFRSTQELVVATIFFGFAAALFGLALLRMFSHYRARVPVVRTLPARTVLGGCLAELARLKTDSTRDGWTPELAGRALAVFRLAGALALGRPIAQAIVDVDEPQREGQIAVKTGLLGNKRALVSGAATVSAIGRALSGPNASRLNPGTKVMLEEIRDSIVAFNSVRYGRNGQAETAELDRVLDNGVPIVRRLRWQRLWPLGLAMVARKIPQVGGVEWSS